MVSVDRALKLAKQYLKQGKTDQAELEYRKILESYPRNQQATEGLRALRRAESEPPKAQVDALIALYNQNDLTAALDQAQALLQQYPQTPLLWNVLGAVQAGLTRFDSAIESYLQALQIKPDYAEGHNNLGAALNSVGRVEEAVVSLQRATELKPNYAEAWNNLGNALAALNKQVEATACYETAVRIKPDYPEAHYNLGNALRSQDRFLDAASSYWNALKVNPAFAPAHNNLGIALNELGKHREANESFKTALAIDPHYPEALHNLGNGYKHFGDTAAAIACLEKALRIKPDYAEAHRSLSVLKKYQADDPEFDQIALQLRRPDLSASDRIHLNFALGKAFADIGNYDQAFASLAEGNKLRKLDLGYDPVATRDKFSRIVALFSGAMPSGDSMEQLQDEPGHRTVFIVGMPRSGTTLVEQILASHSQVYGAGELHLLAEQVNAAFVGKTQLAIDDIRKVRYGYLAGLSVLNATESYVTDKMPFNFLLIGFIVAAFPEAKIIHLQRDARATCWSNFKQYFAHSRVKFAYDLKDIVDYYKFYLDAMAFWQQKYSDRIYNVRYESLTESQEEETRKLLAHLGLDWEDRCLDFHNAERSVLTASAAQVRRGMYSGSSDEWRRYEKHLRPMLELLDGL